jgi:site-specific recombinase XerD
MVGLREASFSVGALLPSGDAGGYWVGFSFERRTTVSKSTPAEQTEQLLYNHHLQEFLTFLKREKGFADATIINRKRSLKPFLAWLVGQCIPLSAVSPVTITKYFTSAVAGRWKRTTVSFHVQSLRSFFRYASSRGWCSAGIAESIDAPRLYTYENLPQGPSWEEVKKLVTSVNGASPVQIRSRCAILLCAVYGLRVGEVCRLRLEDIDWAEEKISVRRSKQRRVQTYPLTTEVGNALLRYLKEFRPRCAHREVLLTLRRPHRPVSVAALSTMTQKQQKRLGMKLKRYGSHVLRHACATHLLAQGLTLKEVGDHLGHVSVAATRIYAKVDLVGLREVAALDVSPLVACIEQCEQIAAPFYRIGEIQALRDVGNLGLGGVA